MSEEKVSKQRSVGQFRRQEINQVFLKNSSILATFGHYFSPNLLKVFFGRTVDLGRTIPLSESHFSYFRFAQVHHQVVHSYPYLHLLLALSLQGFQSRLSTNQSDCGCPLWVCLVSLCCLLAQNNVKLPLPIGRALERSICSQKLFPSGKKKSRLIQESCDASQHVGGCHPASLELLKKSSNPANTCKLP